MNEDEILRRMAMSAPNNQRKVRDAIANLRTGRGAFWGGPDNPSQSDVPAAQMYLDHQQGRDIDRMAELMQMLETLKRTEGRREGYRPPQRELRPGDAI